MLLVCSGKGETGLSELPISPPLERAELVILQSRSPSCGAKRIYDGTFSGKTIEGQGIFARLLRENGFRVVDVEDL